VEGQVQITELERQSIAICLSSGPSTKHEVRGPARHFSGFAAADGELRRRGPTPYPPLNWSVVQRTAAAGPRFWGATIGVMEPKSDTWQYSLKPPR